MKREFHILLFAPAILLGLAMSFQADAQVARSSILNKENEATNKEKLSFDIELGGFTYSEEPDEAQAILLTLSPKLDLEINSFFSAKGQVDFNLASERSQRRTQSPSFQFFNLREAVAWLHPSSWFDLEVGAIDQGHFKNPMFIYKHAFPGARLMTGFVNPEFGFRPKAQYTTPTSKSFESDRNEAEPLPSLTSYGFEAYWKGLSWLSLEADINSFNFSKLPSVVAFSGSQFGNTVSGTDPSESFFIYDYQGFIQSYDLTLNYLTGFSQGFSIKSIENSEAPRDRSRSQLLGTNLLIQTDSYAFQPSFGAFYAESDSTPALYSQFQLGRSNREGQVYGFDVEFKKLRMILKTTYVQSKLIEDQPLQADLEVFEVALEFKNVL